MHTPQPLHAHHAALVSCLLGFLGGCGLTRHAHPTHLYTEPLVANTQDRRATQRHEQRALAQRARAYVPVRVAAKRVKKKRSRRVGGHSSARRARMPSPASPNTQSPVATTTRSADGSTAAQFAWATWARAGRALPEGARRDVERMYKACKKEGVVSFKRITPGDLVFFHNVVDANGDGRNNDWYTHVGVAESVDDRTAVVAAYQDGKVQRLVVNLKHPSGAWQHGRQINTQLRPRRKADLPFTQYMAGELFAGACSTLPRAPVKIDLGWHP